MGSVLGFSRFYTTQVLVHGRGDPTNAEWSSWVRVYAAAVAEHDARDLLFVTDGGGPNAKQRHELISALYKSLGDCAELVRTAVCTDSQSARGIALAIGWQAAPAHLRLFGAADLQGALSFLGVLPSGHADILLGVKRLRTELATLPPPHAFKTPIHGNGGA
jgi:hypothetical protein